MPKSLPDDRRKQIWRRRRAGESCRKIAKDFGIAPSTVWRVVDRAERTNSISPSKRRGHRPRELTSDAVDWMLGILNDHPETTRHELRERLASEWGIHVSITTIWRRLTEAGYNFKNKEVVDAKHTALKPRIHRFIRRAFFQS